MAPIGTEPLAADGTPHRSGRGAPPTYAVAVVAGPDAGTSVPLNTTLLVGSEPNLGLTLNDPTVSRYHLELAPTTTGVRVKDVGSKNGTFVLGAQVHDVVLGPGATVALGRTLLCVVEEVERGPLSERHSFGDVTGSAPAMRALYAALERVAATHATVLLEGETGTGKALVARALHAASPLASGPFVELDCGAIAPGVAESELFGHVRGAFTGAVTDRPGAFARAHAGTLLLHHVSELPEELQPRLLRAIETRRVQPVGADQTVACEARIIATSSPALLSRVQAGQFREDLYYRLAVVQLALPPLRQRLTDIPLLVRKFVQELGSPVDLSTTLIGQLCSSEWPGNVRELRNVVERAVAGLPPTSPDLPRGVAGAPPAMTGLPFKEAKEKLVGEFAREYFTALLERSGGNVSEVARASGLARSHVYSLLIKMGMKVAP